jgi:ankyrin repeat protein
MGKTVLSKFILQELRKQDRQDLLGTPTHTIGYFFDDRVEARRNLNGLIRTLLYLFLLSDTELFRHVRGKYISTTPSLTNDYLIEILNTILEDTKLGQVALIIEGLDECSAATEPEMIDFISSLKDKPNVRLIVTARPQDQIKTAYLPMNSLDLDANSLSPTSSIKLYVKEEIQRVLGESESFPKDFLYEVERVLLNRPSPNFLWVKVAIRYIELQRTILLSRKAIRDLPPGSKVDPLFQKYLQTEFLFDKIPLPSIYIVMEAKAPMTVLGLSFLSAATFEEQSSLINLPDLKMSTIRESTIKNFEYEVADFPFLQVGDNGVSLMHSSLRGILKDTFSPHNGFNTQNGRSTLATRLLEPARKGVEPFLAAVNYFIAELCLTYLLASLQENLDPLDFLRYATLYWFEHVQEAAEHAEKWKKEIEERNRDFSIRNIKIPLAVLDVLTGDNGRKLKEIQELTKTRFGIDKTTFAENDECSITVRGTAKATSIARSLLNKIIEAEKLQQTRRPDSPIEVGYLKTGQGTDSYIIDDEREVKQQDANLSDIINPPETLLSLVKALFCSEKTCHDWTKKPEAHCSVFTKWIRQYTKYDITREKALPVEDTCDTTTFALAAFNLYHILGDHLIEGPANKSLVAKDQNGHTPMHFIVLNNSLASLKWVQERLLADSEFQKFHTLAFQSIEEDPEKLESCPVYLAAEYGNKEMVQLFANSALHAPIQSRQRLGRLLHTVAAKNRHKDIFLLLHEGHFLDLLPEDQQAVAESAATLDCLDVVKKILLEHEGKISTTELLHCAIRSCAEHTIDFLLPLVDINKTSTNGRTALHEAAEVGNDKIVTKLLDRGAFVNALDAARQTPLHLVSKVGFATVCELLLKAGARVSLVDGSGSIPVHYAAANGHDKVLALLVAAGSNLFAADKDGRGPLHLASQATHESSGSTVQALLSLNARVGARDKKGRTSLHYAAQSGNKTIVWMLVDAGADLNVQDDFGVAPIHLAAAGSSDVMITELLRLGADATVRDNERRSVYYHCMASDRPSRAVFQALMENKVPVVGAEISFSAKSREWLEEFEGLVGDVAVSDANGGRKITLTTQSTDEFVRGVVYADDRAESPDNMFRELRALPGGGGASGGRRYGRR